MSETKGQRNFKRGVLRGRIHTANELIEKLSTLQQQVENFQSKSAKHEFNPAKDIMRAAIGSVVEMRDYYQKKYLEV